MKKIIILLFLTLTVFLYSCSNLPYFESDEFDNLIDAENDRLYLYSGSYLRAGRINRTPYARYDGGATLHEIPGIDPAEWLSENFETTGLPLLFRESSIEEPMLETFGTEQIHITQAGEINARIGLITGEQVQMIVDDFVHGEAVDRPFDIEHDYLLYFESPDYQGIYFVLHHLTCRDGQTYLFDRWPPGRAVLTRVSLFGGD
jgi:hypothetical protein